MTEQEKEKKGGAGTDTDQLKAQSPMDVQHCACARRPTILRIKAAALMIPRDTWGGGGGRGHA